MKFVAKEHRSDKVEDLISTPSRNGVPFGSVETSNLAHLWLELLPQIHIVSKEGKTKMLSNKPQTLPLSLIIITRTGHQCMAIVLVS